MTTTHHDQHGQWPAALTVEDFTANLAAVRERIAAACARVDRDPAEVRLLPVSKTKPVEVLRTAYAAGVREFGENKPQEAHGKWQEMQDLDARWCIIGHLQRNKAKLVAECASEFQALDSLRLAETLNRRLEMLDRELDVYVQVNTSGEDSKFGIAPEQARDFVRQLRDFPALRVRGLMTLALFSADADRVRPCFQVLRRLRDEISDDAGTRLELSMGMSGDFDIAIEEGATVVRVGQAIFGARPTSDADYWPPNGASSERK